MSDYWENKLHLFFSGRISFPFDFEKVPPLPHLFLALLACPHNSLTMKKKIVGFLNLDPPVQGGQAKRIGAVVFFISVCRRAPPG